MLTCFVIYTTWVCSIGPFECQDGVTNNCSQNCTRRLINETMSYEYDCGCDLGYATNYSGYCEGENLLACISRNSSYLNH